MKTQQRWPGESRFKGWFYLLPGLAIYLVFIFYPILSTIRNSFYKWNGFSGTREFIQLDNYARLLGDAQFVKALTNNFIFIIFYSIIPILKVADLVGGLEEHLPGRRLVVEGVDRLGETSVFVDAGLLGHALRTIFERVASTLVDEDELHVRLELASRRQYRGVEIEFRGGAASSAGSLKTGIEMAVAEKFLHMHGAELFEREAAVRSLVVFVPLYA